MKYCMTYKTEPYDYEVFVQTFKDTYVRSIGSSPVGGKLGNNSSIEFNLSQMNPQHFNLQASFKPSSRRIHPTPPSKQCTSTYLCMYRTML
jgi:hypothetical protein